MPSTRMVLQGQMSWAGTKCFGTERFVVEWERKIELAHFSPPSTESNFSTLILAQVGL